MQEFFILNGGIILRLVMALILGALIGAERVLVHKEAGMKTHALVSMGAALFVIVSEIMAQKYFGDYNFDPSRIASQIVVGIGFLGAGSIIFQGNKLTGLTTASGLWITAGIGMAAGFGLLSLATISTILVLLVFLFMNLIERPIRKISNGVHENKKLN